MFIYMVILITIYPNVDSPGLVALIWSFVIIISNLTNVTSLCVPDCI